MLKAFLQNIHGRGGHASAWTTFPSKLSRDKVTPFTGLTSISVTPVSLVAIPPDTVFAISKFMGDKLALFLAVFSPCKWSSLCFRR